MTTRNLLSTPSFFTNVPTAFSIIPDFSRMPNIMPEESTTKMMEIAEAKPPGMERKVSKKESGDGST